MHVPFWPQRITWKHAAILAILGLAAIALVYGGSASITPGSGTLEAYVAIPLPFLKNTAKAVITQWSAQ